PTDAPNTITPPDPSFELLIEEALKRLRSPRSRRKYRGVYMQWRDWCDERGIDPHALTVEYVEAFLLSRLKTQSTVNWMLSALRTLLATATLRYPEEPLFERLHNRLRLARVHVEDRSPGEGDPTSNLSL
ncbi:MAG: site-specific integrase, partial [Chloroflexota bacterium]